MAKYRGWIAKVVEIEEFQTSEEAIIWAKNARDKWQTTDSTSEFYFETDDCGSINEEEEL